jgi:hypothetical protein
MGGKAKPTKHTAKELAGRAAASMQNKGGGKAGLADRKGGAAVLPSASVGPAVLDATPSLEAPWGRWAAHAFRGGACSAAQDTTGSRRSACVERSVSPRASSGRVGR